MDADQFNLEDEYGGLLDILEEYISEAEPTLEHYGVKGMKWGVRREGKTREPLVSLGPDSVSRKTSSGETITLKKIPANKIHKTLGRISKKYREGYSKQAMLDILDGSGKKVGDAHVQKRNDDELYLNWLGIDKSARGRGYATAVMKAGRDFGKQEGFKRMVLEVPGNSPDARHIYEKMGFKYTGKESADPFWGGLADMVYEFDAKHSLAHYGVKGMKWGVRKSEGGVHPLQSSAINVESGLHKSTRDAAVEVAGLIRGRYGYNIQNVKVLDERHPQYDPTYMAFVEDNVLAKKNGRNEGTIFVAPRDMSRELKAAADEGWNPPGTGNTKGLLTHETAHSIFHSDQKVSVGLLGGQKITGGHAKARDKALKAAMKAAKQDGRSIWETSVYAVTSGTREELEAEMFSGYHWGTNPPRFVTEWGQTLHRELGLDPTPFKEVKQK